MSTKLGRVREEKEEKERANGVATRHGAAFLHAGLRRVAGPQ